MRSASRVFYSIAVFAVVAALLFGIGDGFDNVQGLSILGVFAISCGYLGFLLGRQAGFDYVGLTLPDPEHGDEIHLPGPSWYPALYGVAGAMVVLGLAFYYPVFIAGVVFLVLVTIGWARESVADYRREVAHTRPGPVLDPAAVELAHRVAAFRAAHYGADAVVQHLGRGRAEIVLVGPDGEWGTVAASDVSVAKLAASLGGATVHESWPAELGRRMAPDPELWRQMSGAGPFHAPEENAPRDGATQLAADVFGLIGIFAGLAAILYYGAQRSWDAIQGTSILATFAIANAYLWVALRHAKAPVAEIRYADERHVTREPTEPVPMDPATLHLPGPSWWPAIFSVAGGAVVLGLAFNYTVLVVGVALLVLSAIGWGVESVREYRTHLAHNAPGEHS